MDENMVEIIDCALDDYNKPWMRGPHFDMFIAQRLHDAGYRLDPYPNGKSKDELIKRIEELEAERDRARNLLYKAASPYIAVQLDHDLLADVNAFLAETSGVRG